MNNGENEIAGDGELDRIKDFDTWLEKVKNDFLMKRENKLQMIEHYVNSKSETNLDRLIRMVKGDK